MMLILNLTCLHNRSLTNPLISCALISQQMEITTFQTATMEGELNRPWCLQMFITKSVWFSVSFFTVFMKFWMLISLVCCQIIWGAWCCFMDSYSQQD